MRKKLLVVGARAVFFSFLHLLCINAQAQNVNTIFEQLKKELQAKGAPVEDIKAIEEPAKNILTAASAKEDLKQAVLDLINKGIKGRDLQGAVASIGDLIKSGEAINAAVNTVFQAVQQAQAMKLKGDMLTAKIREAVDQRKVQLGQVKKSVQQQGQQLKGKPQEIKAEAQKLPKEPQQQVQQPKFKTKTKVIKAEAERLQEEFQVQAQQLRNKVGEAKIETQQFQEVAQEKISDEERGIEKNLP